MVRCPLCQKKLLRIYHDPVYEGQWASCRNCGFHGDMIELAARYWKLSIPATADKLESLGFDLSSEMPLQEALQVYETQFLGVRRKVNAFWLQCQKHFAAAGDAKLRNMQRQLGVGSNNLGKLWLDHGGEILGSCHWLTADTIFNNQGVHRFTKGVARVGSQRFTGKNWDNLLIIPYWRLPGRLAGFLCVGRDMKPEKDFVYIPVQEGGSGIFIGGRTADAGVAMMPAIFDKPNPKLRGMLIVTNDPLMATRLQLRHLKSNVSLLPMVVTYDNGLNISTDKRLWDWVPQERVTFWSPRPNLEIIAQAHEAKANFANYHLPLAEINASWGIMRHHLPHEWISVVDGHSNPWETALRRMMEDMNENEVEELILSLDLTGPALREFTENSMEPLRGVLCNIYTSKARARQVRYDKHIVTEEANGWIVKGVQISSAVVRIEQLLQARSGRNYYRGVILFNEHEIPFTERTETVKTGILQWARDYLEMAGYPGMTYVTSWDKKAINVALSFHMPQVVTGVDAVGWDVDRSQFNFPKFAIKIGGEVLNDYACLFNDKHVPGRLLDPPATLSKKEVQQLSNRDEETAVIWGTIGCVAANVLAPAIHCNTAGLIFDGSGAQTIGNATAAALGCPEHGATDYTISNCKRINRLVNQIGQHHWPYLLRTSRVVELGPIETWLSSETARQSILNLPWAAARIMGIRGWNILRCERKLGATQVRAAVIGRVLPAYLADLCERQLFIDNLSESHVENVIRDMSHWFSDHCNGDSLTVLDSLQLLELPDTYPAYKHFMDAVFRFINDGRIALVRRNFVNLPDGESIVCDVSGEPVVWLPEDRVVDTIEKLASVPPSIMSVKRSLNAAGGLIGQRTYNDKRGWLVDETWWTKEHAEWKARTALIGGPIL